MHYFMKILLMLFQDNVVNRRVLNLLLQKLGCEVFR
jgi:hypothetical protein